MALTHEFHKALFHLQMKVRMKIGTEYEASHYPSKRASYRYNKCGLLEEKQRVTTGEKQGNQELQQEFGPWEPFYLIGYYICDGSMCLSTAPTSQRPWPAIRTGNEIYRYTGSVSKANIDVSLFSLS